LLRREKITAWVRPRSPPPFGAVRGFWCAASGAGLGFPARRRRGRLLGQGSPRPAPRGSPCTFGRLPASGRALSPSRPAGRFGLGSLPSRVCRLVASVRPCAASRLGARARRGVVASRRAAALCVGCLPPKTQTQETLAPLHLIITPPICEIADIFLDKCPQL
jgi:hypothetical protein